MTPDLMLTLALLLGGAAALAGMLRPNAPPRRVRVRVTADKQAPRPVARTRD